MTAPQTDFSDPFLWLEDVMGERALAWVRQRIVELTVRLEHFVHPLRWLRMLQSQPGHHAGRCMPLKPLDNSLPYPSSLPLAFNLRSTL